MDKLIKLLEYLENFLETSRFIEAEAEISDCLAGKAISAPIIRSLISQSEFVRLPYSAVASDMPSMMYNELVTALNVVCGEKHGIPMIRSNYGVGTLPSLFGVKSRIINDNLPWVEHFETLDDIKNLIVSGIPNLENGFGKKIFETYEFYNDMLAKYPNCQKCIKVYHPDFQGPFDVSHLLVGADIYMHLYDYPELIHSLQKLVSQTYIAAMKKIKPYLNDMCGSNCYHWGTVYPGSILLRNDSAVNLSLELYREFVKPYDEIILAEFGNGSMHFCGRADQWVFDMLTTKNLKGINFGYMPNMEFGQTYIDYIYPKFSEHNMSIIDYHLSRDEASTYNFEKYKTGITYALVG